MAGLLILVFIVDSFDIQNRSVSHVIAMMFLTGFVVCIANIVRAVRVKNLSGTPRKR